MRRWVWIGALLLFVGFAHAASPHSHAGHGHAPSPCPICASGSAHFVADAAPVASLFPPPQSPTLILREAAPACATQQSPLSLRAPPVEVLS